MRTEDGLEAGQDVWRVEEGEHLAQGEHESHALPRVEAARHHGPVDGVDDLGGVGAHAVRAVPRDVLQSHGCRQTRRKTKINLLKFLIYNT